MKAISEAIFASRFRADIKSRSLHQLAGLNVPAPGLRVVYSSQVRMLHDATIVARKGGYDILLKRWVKENSQFPTSSILARRVAAVLYWRLQAQEAVTSVSFNLSDGDKFSDAGFGFSTCSADVTTVPDVYFFKKRGFAGIRDAIPSMDVAWSARTGGFVWRGEINGNGYLNVYPELANSPATMQRVRMAWHCTGTDVDFGFVVSPKSSFYPALNKAGFLGERVDPLTWFSRKYAIDIDGATNTWDNLYHRMLMGCCVLKVASDFGYRQWYYHRLIPWEHFVPVAADLSDWDEKKTWVMDNDNEAQAIAENGRALAMSMTFKSEAKVAGQLIDENWQRYL